MKRKIAAIFAADIAGYSRLVAEDEEETLRRLASYRQVTDDFIAKGGGRIFNTAGDAVLAEFPSAVEAVRCAIDIQESLRTRNMAYPPSRQMAFRIGITIGDVVERDGDLLGDGVNIAARLEGLAEVGGICISRAVHEQVANKLSVQFADIGAQEVKNIPTPVHAYMVAMRREDGTYATPQVKKPAKPHGVAAELDVAGGGHAGLPGRDRCRRLSLFHQAGDVGAVKVASPSSNASPAPSAARANAGSGCAARLLQRRVTAPPRLPPAPSPPPMAFDRKIRRRERPVRQRHGPRTLAQRLCAGGRLQGVRAQHRRLQRLRHRSAERGGRENGRASSNARSAPMPRSRRANANSTRSAIPSFMPHGKPPVPPLPWIRHDAATEKPFAAKDVPLLARRRQGEA